MRFQDTLFLEKINNTLFAYYSKFSVLLIMFDPHLYYKSSQGSVPLGPHSYHISKVIPVTVISTSKLLLACTIKIVLLAHGTVQGGCPCKVAFLQVVTQEPRLLLLVALPSSGYLESFPVS